MLGDSFLAEQRLLVVAPHPDDEAIGCAGTIARVKALGGQAYVMIVSAGGITQHGRGAGGQGREFVSGEQRMAEFEDVMSYLKVDGHEVLLDDDASHERLDTVPQRELIERIEYAAELSLENLRPVHAADPRPQLQPGPRRDVPGLRGRDQARVRRGAAFCAIRAGLRQHHGVLGRAGRVVRAERVRQHLGLPRHQDRGHGAVLLPAAPPPYHASQQGAEITAAFFGGQVSIAAAEAFQALRLVW